MQTITPTKITEVDGKKHYFPEFIRYPDIIPVQIGNPLADDYIECLSVGVEEEEYYVCEVSSWAENFWSNSKSGTFGKGLIYTEEDKYRTVRTGLLGQMAFAKVIGEPLDISYRKYGDKYDFLINGLTVDVKCSTKDMGKNFVCCVTERGVNLPVNKHIYVCSYLEYENRIEMKANVILVGYTTKDKVAKLPLKKGHRGGTHMNREIEFEYTTSITELVNRKLKRCGRKILENGNQVIVDVDF